MVRHAPIHRRSGHSDIAICCGRNVRGSSPSTSVVPLSNQVTTLNHKRFKGFKMFSDGHSVKQDGGKIFPRKTTSGLIALTVIYEVGTVTEDYIFQLDDRGDGTVAWTVIRTAGKINKMS